MAVARIVHVLRFRLKNEPLRNAFSPIEPALKSFLAQSIQANVSARQSQPAGSCDEDGAAHRAAGSDRAEAGAAPTFCRNRELSRAERRSGACSNSESFAGSVRGLGTAHGAGASLRRLHLQTAADALKFRSLRLPHPGRINNLLKAHKGHREGPFKGFSNILKFVYDN